jgi:NADPH-dependent 2,4-dienoyl-CoA reductase/sulfur reductase-like enzyme
VEAGAVVLATGARERYLPFPGWTLPGVVGIGGAQALAKAGTDVRGRRVVIAGSGPLLLPVAALLARRGARVSLVAEQAPPERVRGFARSLALAAPRKLVQAARYRAAFAGTPYRAGTWVVRAEGESHLSAVTLTDGRRRWTEPCDLLATGYGLVPNAELARLLGCELSGGFVAVNAYQRTSVEGLYAAGEPTGIAGVEAALMEGELAGLAAAGRAAAADERPRALEREHRLAARMEQAFALRLELHALADAETIVCRCEDVRLGQIDPSWCARQAKLYTRAGMGPCQGRVCGPALEHLFGWPPDRVRPPLAVSSVGALLAPAEGG